MKHAHRAAKIKGPYPFTGPAEGPYPNPVAHGGIARVHICSCGARKVVNYNGHAEEHGRWTKP